MSLLRRALHTLAEEAKSDNATHLLQVLTIVSEEDEEMVIEASNPFYARWFTDHYQDRVERIITSLTGGRKVNLTVVHPGHNGCWKPEDTKGDGKADGVSPGGVTCAAEPAPSSQATMGSRSGSAIINDPIEFNDHYSFQSFIVGQSNRTAFSAAEAVAASPGNAFNPLYIHGRTGLGKTHLLKAIGRHLINRNRNTRVLYRTSSDFLQEFVHNIKNDAWNECRKIYENCDALLIDDVQFWASKPQTQNEFFHIFNHLHKHGKQMVLTSDLPPSEMKGIEDRLISRFSFGLLAEILPPCRETRKAIVRAKLKNLNAEISEDIVDFLADIYQNHVRELEGAVNVVVFWEKCFNRNITLEDAIAHFGVKSRNSISTSIDSVADLISSHYKIDLENLRSRRRHQSIVMPRQVFWYLCRNTLNMEVARIARWSSKDRSTILSGIKKVERLLSEDKFLQTDIRALSQRLQNQL